jgi:hypothetical protein
MRPAARARSWCSPHPEQLADERRWFTHELRETDRWRPDLDRLRSIGTRIVVAIGGESAGQICERTAMALRHLRG